MKKLRQLYYRIFKHYKVLETVFVTYAEADRMIKDGIGKSESELWWIAKEEDDNHIFGMVYLCRKIRIV